MINIFNATLWHLAIFSKVFKELADLNTIARNSIQSRQLTR